MPICNLLEKTGACNGVFAYKGDYMQKIKIFRMSQYKNPKRVIHPSLRSGFNLSAPLTVWFRGSDFDGQILTLRIFLLLWRSIYNPAGRIPHKMAGLVVARGRSRLSGFFELRIER